MRARAAIAVLILAGILSACGASSSEDRAAKADAAAEKAEADEAAMLSGQTYKDSNETTDCTTDCSGHEAGWKWAKDHDIEDESDCTGNSDSFVEGCRAYVQHVADAGTDASDAVMADKKSEE